MVVTALVTSDFWLIPRASFQPVFSGRHRPVTQTSGRRCFDCPGTETGSSTSKLVLLLGMAAQLFPLLGADVRISPRPEWPQPARLQIHEHLAGGAGGRLLPGLALLTAVPGDDSDQPAVGSLLDDAHAVTMEGAGRRRALRHKRGTASHAGQAKAPDRLKRGSALSFKTRDNSFFCHAVHSYR